MVYILDCMLWAHQLQHASPLYPLINDAPTLNLYKK